MSNLDRFCEFADCENKAKYYAKNLDMMICETCAEAIACYGNLCGDEEPEDEL